MRWVVIVLCWQFTAADTSCGSIGTTCGPKSSRARGRCRCDAGGPCRRGTASYRASSSSPCPAPTRSQGQFKASSLPVLFSSPLFLFKIKTLLLFSASFHLLIQWSVKWVKTQLNKSKFLCRCHTEHPPNSFIPERAGSLLVSLNWKSNLCCCQVKSCPAVFCWDRVGLILDYFVVMT